MEDEVVKKPARPRRSKLKICLLLLCLFSLLGGFGGYVYLNRGLPDIRQIDSYQPSLTTRLYALDGREFAQFAVEKRILVPISAIPRALTDAIVSVEDASFYEHHGIDWQGILRAAIKNLKAGRFVEGGSTITQQLARALFLNPRKTIARKLREALLSLKIERSYSKENILELYLNQVYFGHGAYGVESAAHAYFDKSVSDLDLAECALIAGLPRAPNSYSPIRHPIKANQRKKHVLDRMLAEGRITQEEYQAAAEEKLRVRHNKGGKSAAPYFTEHIRRQLEQKYGSTALYRSGMKVYTTVNLRLQHLAQDALRWGIKELDRRQGYRIITEETVIPPKFIPPEDLASLEIGREYLGTVEVVTPAELTVRIGKCLGRLPKRQMNWLRSKPEAVFKPGDKVITKVLGLEKTAAQVLYTLALEQEPLAQGSIVVLDPATGYILAMVGGYDFETSKFNRAVQARRQPGSSFKPIIYTTALMQGLTLADIILDTAIIYKDEMMDEDWKPVNYYERFYGPTTLRRALEHSRNVVTVKLLERVGIENAIKTARLLGIKSLLVDDLSLALGSSGVTLLELTSAYGVFPNGGVRVPPISIRYVTDNEGNILEENCPSPKRVLDEKTAYLMTSLLQGVVEHGTGRRARQIGRPLAGKTGTTNKYIDAWFMGFSPQIVTGVWIGMDEHKSMGPVETGSRAACPVWVRFMKDALMNTPVQDFRPPPGIVRVSIDTESGLLATNECEKIIVEDFIEGTQPTQLCDRHQPTGDKFLKVDMDLSREEFELADAAVDQPETTEAVFSFD
jgi:penicillin-binding protein 1A